MEKTSGDLFRKAMDKAFSGPGMTINPTTMLDNQKFKQSFKEENELEGGLSDDKTLLDIAMEHAFGDKAVTTKRRIESILKLLRRQLQKGIKVEMEHTKNHQKAKEIAMDHLSEDPKYYDKLEKIETKEQLIVKPITKSKMNKILGKERKMDKPIGKLFSLGKSETKEGDDENISPRRQFSKDLQTDPDYKEFKKNSKYKQGYKEFDFGVPNVTREDPYIKLKKWGRFGKGETTEATSSGSSGAFSGPIAFKDSEFLRKSFAETPKKLKEGLATSAMGIDKVEAKEATTSGSVGGYETPSMWAKSTKKKDWGPSRKTQLPGGAFVKVKKKCTKFPYCNQGDINALTLSKNESVKEAIENISKKYKIGKNVIMNILENEFHKHIKRKN